MSISGKQWTIAAGGHEAVLAEVGAGLKRYRLDGADVTCGYGDDVLPPKCCGTTLVPWPNRIRDGRYSFDGVGQQLALTEPDPGNAIHGLGRWARWSEVEHAADAVTLGLDVVPQKGYPYEIRAEVTYAVHPATGLTVTLSARNTGRVRAPFGAGSHPFLSARGQRLDDLRLTVPVATTFDVDDHQIPVRTRPIRPAEDFRAGDRLGERRFDQGFTDVAPRDGGRATVRLGGDAFTTTLWFDEAFRYLQVFTVDELSAGDAGVAFEPMTCAPDAFNSGAGLLVLEPGERWVGSWGIVSS